MADKRNIVIKVKYPVPGKSAGKVAPKMVTQWNVKRILFAAAAVILASGALFYVINENMQNVGIDNSTVRVNNLDKQAVPEDGANVAQAAKPEAPNQAVAKNNLTVNPEKAPNKKIRQASDIKIKEPLKKQPDEKVIKGQVHSRVNQHVLRTSLTYRINNKEPAGDAVRDVVVSHKRPVWVYYFTELKAMGGNKVYHEWLKNNVVVSRQELVISGDIWRTSSRKLLSVSEKGKWAVRLVDRNGHLLNEKTFKVE